MRLTLTATPILLLAAACSGESCAVDLGEVDASGPIDAGSRDATGADRGVLDALPGEDVAPAADALPALDAFTGDADPRPILERAPDLRFDCTIARGVVNHLPRSWAGIGQSIAVADGQFVLARVENTTLVVSTLESARFGASTTVAADATMVSGTAIAPSAAGGWAIAFSENGALRFATRAGAGAPRDIIRPGGVQENLQMLARPGGGYALIWQHRVDFDSPAELQFALLADDGSLSGQVRTIVRAAMPYNTFPARLALRPGGFAIIWTEREPPVSRIRLRVLDATGAPGAVVDLAMSGAGGGFASDVLALVARPSGLLAAWAEGYFNNDFSNPLGWTVIRVAPLGPDGRPLGPIAALQASEDHVDHVEPELLELGGSVALLWSRGGRIYVCAGCIPDHGLQLVMLDPERLVPRSPVLTIDDMVSGGLLSHSSAVLGSDLAIPMRMVFHVHSEPASAFARCVAR